MAQIDDIEFYGRAVNAGEMTRDEAVTKLVAASHGGLTRLSAEDLITNWQNTRRRYEEEHNRAFHGIAAAENGRKPHPSNHPARP